jgi:hypothetical protein
MRVSDWRSLDSDAKMSNLWTFEHPFSRVWHVLFKMKNRCLIEVHDDPMDIDSNTEEAPRKLGCVQSNARFGDSSKSGTRKNKKKQQKAVPGPPRAVLGSLKSVPGRLSVPGRTVSVPGLSEAHSVEVGDDDNSLGDHGSDI